MIRRKAHSAGATTAPPQAVLKFADRLRPVRRDSAQHSTAWLGPARPGTVRHGPARSSTVQHGPARSGTTQHGPARPSTAQHGPARPSTTQHDPAQRSTARIAQDSPAGAGTSRHGTARPGTARRGAARRGTARHGAARRGTAQHSPARHGATHHTTPHHGTARHGTATHGAARPSTASLSLARLGSALRGPAQLDSVSPRAGRPPVCRNSAQRRGAKPCSIGPRLGGACGTRSPKHCREPVGPSVSRACAPRRGRHATTGRQPGHPQCPHATRLCLERRRAPRMFHVKHQGTHTPTERLYPGEVVRSPHSSGTKHDGRMSSTPCSGAPRLHPPDATPPRGTRPCRIEDSSDPDGAFGPPTQPMACRPYSETAALACCDFSCRPRSST
jgi:hypothetical protein